MAQRSIFYYWSSWTRGFSQLIANPAKASSPENAEKLYGSKAIILKMVLALISDLFFISRVQSASQAAGLGFESLDAYKTVREFLDLLHQRKPSLIVLDLNSALPWPEWLPAAKADQHASQIPWLAFGSHMNPRRLAAARHAGADKVAAKSKFAQELASVIGELTTDKHR